MDLLQIDYNFPWFFFNSPQIISFFAESHFILNRNRWSSFNLLWLSHLPPFLAVFISHLLLVSFFWNSCYPWTLTLFKVFSFPIQLTPITLSISKHFTNSHNLFVALIFFNLELLFISNQWSSLVIHQQTSFSTFQVPFKFLKSF